MKKKVAILISMVMVVCVLALTACGSGGNKDVSNSKYVGTWKAVSMSLADVEEPYEEEFLIILNADGTAQIKGSDEVTDCKWEETKDGFKLTEGTKMTFTDDGEGVKSKILGTDLHFERQA